MELDDRAILRNSPYYNLWPNIVKISLQNPIEEEETEPYTHPPFENDYPKISPALPEKKSKTNIYFPSRISMPIVELPGEIKGYITNTSQSMMTGVHEGVAAEVAFFRTKLVEFMGEKEYTEADKTFDLIEVKSLAEMKFSEKSKISSKIASELSQDFTKRDMALAADIEPKDLTQQFSVPEFPSFLYMLHRVRNLIPQQERIGKAEMGHNLKRLMGDQKERDEPNVVLRGDNSYSVYSNCKDYSYWSMFTSAFFAFYHSGIGKIVIGTSVTFDYLLTFCEVNYNLKFISSVQEYRWASEIISLLNEVANAKTDINNIASFMKNYETLCLHLSDTKEGELVAWDPIIDTLSNLNEISSEIRGEDTDLDIIYSEYLGIRIGGDSGNFFVNILRSLRKLSGKNLQEISALHKLHCYASVDEDEGMTKYLSRVHTKRKVDQSAIKDMISLAKKEFTISFCRREKMLPPLDSEDGSHITVVNSYNKNSMRKMQKLPIAAWDNVIIGKCLESTLTNDPVQYAKDKGALKESINFGPGDSMKELIQVIKREDYNLKRFNLEDFRVRQHARVWRGRRRKASALFDYICRLIKKEREQNKMSRNFGNTTVDNKHALSRMMNLCKKVLNFYDGEFMTISDSTRKKKLHEAGQLLAFKHKYSLLLDIEGHNQSMQEDNTKDLLEFIGQLYGEEGWGHLSNYFGRMDVYFYKDYMDEVIHSVGQHGGIEGWMNPVWTLSTLLMVKLLPVLTDIVVEETMVYSDDVNLIINILNTDPTYVNEIYKTVERHCLRFGMKVKLTQTAISKHRVTLLRTHYYDGELSDSTLKKLVSCTMFNNNSVLNDDSEVEAICSSISSALSMTNHPYTPTLMKWHKSILVTERSYRSLFKKQRENSMIDQEHLGPHLANLLYRTKSDSELLEGQKNIGIVHAIKEELEMYGKERGMKYVDEQNRNILGIYFGESLQSRCEIKLEDMVSYLMLNNDLIREIYLFVLLMPQSLGGKGLSLFINQAISGHSVGIFKSLYYNHKLLRTNDVFNAWTKHAFKAALGSRIKEGEIFPESSLATAVWPNNNGIRTLSAAIESKLKAYFSKNCVNIRIRRWFEIDTKRKHFQTEIVDLFRKNFSSRIVQFYAETNVYYLVDMLLKKVEDIMSLLPSLANKKNFRSILQKMQIENGLILLSNNNNSYGDIEHDTDILTYLVRRRQSMYPEIVFSEIEEPLYDDYLVSCNHIESLFICHEASGKTVVGNVSTRNAPRCGTEVLYKGEFKRDDLMYPSLEEFLAMKLTGVTKWIISNSLNSYNENTDYSGYNVVKATNYCLNTICDKNFNELKEGSPLASGGEIQHRIPNLRFKKSSYIRILPEYSTQTHCSINQTLYVEQEYEDSNINVELLQNRITLKMIMRNYLKIKRMFKFEGKLLLTPNIVNVQRSFIYITDKEIEATDHYKTAVKKIDLNLTRMMYYSHSYFSEDMDKVSYCPAGTEADEYTIFLEKEDLLRKILTYYNDLRRNHIYEKSPMFSPDPWRPFINRTKRVTSRWSSKTTDEIMKDIETLLTNVPLSMLRSNRVYTSAIDETEVNRMVMQQFEKKYPKYTLTNIFFSRLSSYLRRSPSDETDDSADKALMLKRTQLHDDRQMIYRAFLLDVLINYTASYIYRAGRVTIDKARILDDTLAFFQAYQPNVKLNLREEWPIALFGPEIILSYFRDNHIELLNILNNWLSNISISDIILDYQDRVKIEDDSLPTEMIMPDSLKKSSSKSCVIDNIFWTDNEIRGRIINNITNISKIYSNPIVFYSNTGSDALVAQYNLFRHLKMENIISEGTNVCDLTAGRGDGHMAMTNLKIIHSSYALSDTFTNLQSIKGVIHNETYDIMDTSTLSFTDYFDHIHIDISFTKKGDNDLTNTILYYVMLGKNLSIRINSIRWNEKLVLNAVEKEDCQCFIVYPSEGVYKYYQIYLIILPRRKCNILENDDKRASTWISTLLNAFTSIVEYGNMVDFSMMIGTNSYNKILCRDNRYMQIVQNLYDDEQNIKLRNTEAKILDNSHLRDKIIINLDCIPKSFYDLYKDLGRPTEGTYEDIYKEEVTEYKSYKSTVKNKTQHKDAILNNKGRNRLIPWTKDNIDLLTITSRLHPLAAARTLLVAQQASMREEFDPFKDNLEELSSQHLQQVTKCLFTDSPMTKTYREAFLILYYAAIHNDYSIGIKCLYEKYRENTAKKSHLISVIYKYRCMANVFSEMRDQLSRFDRDTELAGNIFREYMMVSSTREFKTNAMKKIRKKNSKDPFVREYHKLNEEEQKGFKDKFNDIAEKIYEAILKGDIGMKTGLDGDLIMPSTTLSTTLDLSQTLNTAIPNAMKSGFGLDEVFKLFTDRLRNMSAEEEAAIKREMAECDDNFDYAAQMEDEQYEEYEEGLISDELVHGAIVNSIPSTSEPTSSSGYPAGDVYMSELDPDSWAYLE